MSLFKKKSLPIIDDRYLPNYMKTPLKELQKAHIESIQKSSTPRKSPKKERSPKSSTPRKSPKKKRSPKSSNVVSPCPNYTNYHYINDPNENNLALINPADFERDTNKMPEIKSKSKRKHEIKLPDVTAYTNSNRPIISKPKLPSISAGKRRTRKHKSNRRRTLRKK